MRKYWLVLKSGNSKDEINHFISVMTLIKYSFDNFGGHLFFIQFSLKFS